MINLISDTVTKPTKPMLEAMFAAQVGDDVFREDPTVQSLEEFAARMFGMESGLFCPSGTMSNQIAIKTHTTSMEEMICDKDSHVYQFENGGYAWHSGIAVQLLDGISGKITAEQISEAIRPNNDWFPESKLVVIENTTNKGGGAYYSLEEVRKIRTICNHKGLLLHLDGARIFNALAETNENPIEWGQYFDSISICLSKGLGAPVGSLLLGSTKFINKARRFRKGMGGGMRQAGYLAAAGLYALQNHIDRIKDDHIRAKAIEKILLSKKWVKSLRPVQTNIIIFDLIDDISAQDFSTVLLTKGIKVSVFGPQTIRLVTHLDYDDQDLEKTLEVLDQYKV